MKKRNENSLNIQIKSCVLFVPEYVITFSPPSPRFKVGLPECSIGVIDILDLPNVWIGEVKAETEALIWEQDPRG